MANPCMSTRSLELDLLGCLAVCLTLMAATQFRFERAEV